MAEVRTQPNAQNGRMNPRFERWYHHKNKGKRQGCLSSCQNRNSARKNLPQVENRLQDRRPCFMRLDSTGENSCGSTSSGELSGSSSPQSDSGLCSSQLFCAPVVPINTHQSRNDRSTSGGSLLDKVKSAVRSPYKGTYNRNLVYQRDSYPEGRLADLDSVAEKFTTCNMMGSNDPMMQSGPRRPYGLGNLHEHDSHFRGNPPPQRRFTEGFFNPHAARNQQAYFHPYHEGPAGAGNQNNFIPSAQKYHRTFQQSQPWQRMMNPGAPPLVSQFGPGFGNFGHPGMNQWQRQQQHPQLPWQRGFLPPHHQSVMMMMQGRRNYSQGPVYPQQKRTRSPSKNQRQRRNYRGKNQKTAQPRHNTPTAGAHLTKSKDSQKESEIVQVATAIPDVNVQVENSMKCVTENVDDGVHQSAIIDPSPIHVVEKEDNVVESTEDVQPSSCNAESDSSMCQVEEMDEVTSGSSENKEQVGLTRAGIPPLHRHSSIELILADYSSRVESIHVDELSESDFEESEGDSDSAVETHSDLWDSFTSTDDPYNPLHGWRCTKQTPERESPPLASGNVRSRSAHIDSGTDEGDEWSETDSDDDYGSDNEACDGDGDQHVPDYMYQMPSLGQHKSLEMAAPQLRELKDNLSSTPKDASKTSTGAHQSSVAFILGSPPTSDDEEEDDWDTLDDTSNLQDDLLWNSFNKAKDPYSPLNAWKCQGSGLAASPLTPTLRHADSFTLSIRTRHLSDESTQSEITPPHGGKHTEDSKDRSASNSSLSDGPTFYIAVRVFPAKDETDGPVTPTVPESPAMRRAASGSCLKKVHLTSKAKANKKVRFCPTSSFIVLVEREPTSCENNPSADWVVCARDRLRFKARIDEAAKVLDPVFTTAHRERMYQSLFGVR